MSKHCSFTYTTNTVTIENQQSYTCKTENFIHKYSSMHHQVVVFVLIWI